MSFKLIFSLFLTISNGRQITKGKITLSHTFNTLFYLNYSLKGLTRCVLNTKSLRTLRNMQGKAILSQGLYMGRFGSVPRSVIVSEPDYWEDR